jgi:uncharacterized protein YndB with AHSA1/START domain
MREMRPMTFADIDAAPFRFSASGTVPCTPEELFEELGDPSRWTRWFPMMRSARWTSADTERAGAEREVFVLGFGRFRERILAWDPGARFAFTMLASTSPLAHEMGEDWRVSPAPGGARLEWTLAAVPTGIGKVATKALPAILSVIFKRALRSLTKRANARR